MDTGNSAALPWLQAAAAAQVAQMALQLEEALWKSSQTVL